MVIVRKHTGITEDFRGKFLFGFETGLDFSENVSHSGPGPTLGSSNIWRVRWGVVRGVGHRNCGHSKWVCIESSR